MIVTVRIMAAGICFSVALAACNATSVRRPLSRSEDYRTTVAEYKTATVVPSETEKDDRDRGWKQRPLPADSTVKATISGRAQMGVLRVHFADESEPRPVLPPQDYTSYLEIRAKGTRLYVYRTVVLLWTEHRLAVYDLANRRLQTDLLVDPADMPGSAVP